MSENNDAQELLDSRLSVYGPRVKNMQDVAQVWSGILGHEVRADQVTLMMIGYKLVRASGTPDYEDNIKDVEGYALMFREIIGDDMVSAFTTDEYLKAKEPCLACGKGYTANHEACTIRVPEAGESELSRRERAYNATVDAAEAEDQAADLQQDLLGYSEVATATLNAERQAIGLPPVSRPPVVPHELRLAVARLMPDFASTQTLINTAERFDILFEDVFTRDRVRAGNGVSPLRFQDVGSAYESWEAHNKVHTAVPASGGANAVWRLLVDDRSSRNG